MSKENSLKGPNPFQRRENKKTKAYKFSSEMSIFTVQQSLKFNLPRDWLVQ